MVYDDIIIGSGLTALATMLGLDPSRRIAVITGGAEDRISHYSGTQNVPLANQGFAGLGSYWHGVIPCPHLDEDNPTENYKTLFSEFYPDHTDHFSYGSDWLFVPKRPIRPKPIWLKSQEFRGVNLTLVHTQATEVFRVGQGFQVSLAEGSKLKGTRLWLAAGTLGTAQLLRQSAPFATAVNSQVSDHLILYMGQLKRADDPNFRSAEVRRSNHGYHLKIAKEFPSSALFTKKPARFGFKKLDAGIMKRAAFGLPTKGAIGKISRSGSLGLVSEALFNKYGVFPKSSTQSVYAQVRVENAYTIETGGFSVTANSEKIEEKISNLHAEIKIASFRPSRQRQLYVNGIHLHGSVDTQKASEFGLMGMEHGCAIVDPATTTNIGHKHHSFEHMAKAHALASQST